MRGWRSTGLACLLSLYASSALAAESWTEADKAAAAAVATNSGEEWGNCLIAASDRFSVLNELPETIATAAFGSCGAEEALYRAALVDSFRGYLESKARASAAEEIIVSGKRKFRETIFARLLNKRLRAKRAVPK